MRNGSMDANRLAGVLIPLCLFSFLCCVAPAGAECGDSGNASQRAVAWEPSEDRAVAVATAFLLQREDAELYADKPAQVRETATGWRVWFPRKDGNVRPDKALVEVERDTGVVRWVPVR